MTSSAPAARGDAASHTHTKHISVPQSLIRALPLGIVSVCLDSSYEATVIGGARSIDWACHHHSQERHWQESVRRWPPGSTGPDCGPHYVGRWAIPDGHSQSDLQRAAKDWDSTIELVTDTLTKRGIAFYRAFYDSCAKHSLHLWMRFPPVPMWNPFVRSM